jgi:hypothetical protein
MGIMPELLEELLHPSQYSAVKGKAIFQAAGTIRDVIAYVDVTHQPLCVISLDFKEAFDKVSHDYLFATTQDPWRYRFRICIRNAICISY